MTFQAMTLFVDKIATTAVTTAMLAALPLAAIMFTAPSF